MTIDEKLMNYLSLKEEIDKKQNKLEDIKSEIQAELKEKNMDFYKNAMCSISYVKPSSKVVLDIDSLARNEASLYNELIQDYGLTKIRAGYFVIKRNK